jgi:hypothetical protein
MFLRNSLLSLLTANAVSAALDPISIVGNKFFFSNGSQFYIKGVAYQQDIGAGGAVSSTTPFIDPLASGSNCQRDVPLLAALGTNLVRTYAIDPTQDHSACMGLLDSAGIYVLADLGSPTESIDRDNPAWTTDLFARYTSVVDTMQAYSNVIGFFAGNEVTNSNLTTQASAFVKAAVRDTKAYIKAKGYHTMGVGYASDDDQFTRNQVSDFMNCGDPADSIDFWGYNIYEWCGLSSFTSSGYNLRTEDFANYTVPAFFAEYGCNTGVGAGTPDAATRPWTEVGALYGSQMDDVWSGGIAYEYFQETNNFGLVTIDGSSASTLADYNNLKSQLATVSPTIVQSSTFTPTNTVARNCPTLSASFWEATSTPLPPSPDTELCNCMMTSLSCTVKSGISDAAVGSLLGEICDPTGVFVKNTPNVCAGINHDASTGDYGSYSMCLGSQQLAFAMNTYFLNQDSANQASACDFSGNATTQSPSSATGDCVSLLKAAGTAGTGTVSSNPTAGAGSTGTSGSSASSSKSAATGNFVPGLGAGWSTFIPMVVYISGAAAVGMGMVWM